MVVGRILFLSLLCVVTALVLVVERAIGLPVMFFLLFITPYTLLRQYERTVFFLFTIFMVSIVYGLSLFMAGLFLLGLVIVPALLARSTTSTFSIPAKIISQLVLLIVFALVVQIDWNGFLALYTLLLTVLALWWRSAQARSTRTNLTEHEAVVVFH